MIITIESLDHPNLVKVYFNFAYIDEETEESNYYIGMEYVQTDLEKILLK